MSALHRALTAALLLALQPATLFAVPLLQGPYVAYATNGSDTSPVIADLDHDGFLDLALVNASSAPSAGVRLWMGNGDGTLVRSPTEVPGALIVNIVLTDMNGDGEPDLVATGYGATRVYLGHGNLIFDPPIWYTGDLNGACNALAVADVTGDGVPDVIAGDSTNVVQVRPGVGDGTLAPPIVIPAAVSPVWLGANLTTGDLDGDGETDLIVGSDSAQVFLSTAGGVFAAPDVYHVAGDALLAFVDGDAHLDMVVGTSWLQGSADGTFGPPEAFNLTPSSGALVHAVRDFNGDGHNDLLVYEQDTGSGLGYLRVYLGDGMGGVVPAPRYRFQFGFYYAVVGDLDADGNLDVVSSAENTAGEFIVLHGNGDGSFGAQRDYATPGDPVAVGVGEVTGDAHQDVIALSPSSATVRVFPGLGDGELDTPFDLATPADPRRFALGDVDGDHRVDLVTANGTSNGISVFPGLPGGGFGGRTDYVMGSTTLDVVVSDLNGDEIGDVVALGAANTFSVFPGQMGGPLGSRVDYPTSSPPTRLFVGRVNGDAYPDVVVHCRNAAWAVHLGQTGGVLGGPSFVSNGQWVGIAGDVSGDGLLDLLATTTVFDLYVEIGNGDGSFTALERQRQPSIMGRPVSLVLGDMDDDGHVDLVTANQLLGVGAVHLGDGTGPFPLEYGYGSAGNPLDVALGDLNGNGRLDAVLANELSSNITVLLDDAGSAASVGPAADAAGGLSFARVWPVPSAGPVLSAAFHLPAAGEVRLELVDLAGRRLAEQAYAQMEPGEQQATLAVPAGTPPGVYWLRLSQAGRTASARVVVMK